MYALTRYKELLITYLKPLWPKVLLLTFLLLSGIGLQLINPQIIRYFIDTAQSDGSHQTLTIAALIFVSFALLLQVISLATTYVGEDVGWAATNQLRADLTRHCLRLDMPFHKKHRPGELIERIDGDVTLLANFFSQLVIRVLGNVLLALGILLLLFRENWGVGLVGLGYILLLFFFLRAVRNWSVRLWRANQEAWAQLLGYLEERLIGIEDIRANGAEAYIMRRLYELMRDLLYKERRAAVMGSFTFVSGWGLYVLSYVGALAIGARLFLDGQLTIGAVYLIIHYIGLLETPLNEIRRQITDLQRALAGIQRIDELFALQPRLEATPAPVLVATPPLDGALSRDSVLPPGPLSVQFDRVTFGYDERENILDDVSWQLAAGRVLGLLGRTGSGKTTITRLLFRLYDPVAGTIRLDGQHIGDLPLDELRQHVAMVTQDVQLFAATIRDNITFFNKAISDRQILDVIELLGLQPWYRSLPAGLDSYLGGGGQGLSAGEAQLLALARVFLRNPGLVILDEASSRLDPATEQLIERAIDRLLQNRTAIIVAHRLETVQRADDILILEKGRICEYGRREQLAADPHSIYAQLVQTGLGLLETTNGKTAESAQHSPPESAAISLAKGVLI
jgi:ABC-type multidrug transport system fused ATPase/permease subunit